MPLTLTTPLSSGDLDPGASSYTQMKIIEFGINTTMKRLSVLVQAGNTVEGDWVGAPVVKNVTRREFLITGADYDTLVAKTSSAAGEIYYDEVARELYQYLIDKGYYAGTIG